MYDYIKLSVAQLPSASGSVDANEQDHLLQGDADQPQDKGTTKPARASQRTEHTWRSSKSVKEWQKQVGLAVLISVLAFTAGRLSSLRSTILENTGRDVESTTQVSLSEPTGEATWKDLLNDRFGLSTSRASTELQSIPDDLAQEVQAIWNDTRLSHDPAFMGAYVARKRREAELWTLLIGNADSDSSGTYSYSERQELFKTLGAAQDGDKLILQNCTLSMEDCFSRSYFFDYDGPEQDIIGPQHLLKWVAFVQPHCGECLLAAAASPVVCDEATAACPSLGGTDRSWKTVAYNRVDVEHGQ